MQKVGLLALILIGFGTYRATSQTIDEEILHKKEMKIRLKSREIMLNKEVAFIAKKQESYLLLSFTKMPKCDELIELGIKPLSYLDGNTIYAHVPDGLSLSSIEDLIWASPLEPADKIEQDLKVKCLIKSEDNLHILVYLPSDILPSEVARFCHSHTIVAEPNQSLPHYLLSLTISKDKVDELAADNLVSWMVETPERIKSGRPFHFCAGASSSYGTLAEFATPQKFVTQGSGWDGAGLGCADVSYHFVNGTPDIAGTEEQDIIVAQMAKWAQYTGITFTETQEAGLPNSIDIKWTFNQYHDDGRSFDGQYGLLAFAFFPEFGGDLFFDEAEIWNEQPTKLATIALHELGHTLGLRHSADNNAIMSPFYNTLLVGLQQDDIDGIQSLYSSTACGYCTSAGQNVADEFIGKVELGTINNVSTAQVYSDFPSISTELTMEDNYTITVTPTWTSTAYPEGYSVWIDYNRDGDFADAGEQVWTKAPGTSTSVSGNFTIPSNAAIGTTRMRVSMKWNGIPTSCETFQYGEVEDYTVLIKASGQDTLAPSVPLNLSVSNVTDTSATLSWVESVDNIGVLGYAIYRGSSLIGSIPSSSTPTFELNGLAENTSYNSITVIAGDETGNLSEASNAVSFTTLSPPDTIAPTVPLNLSVSNITETTATLSWAASTDNIGVAAYAVFDGTSFIGSIGNSSTPTFELTGLTANTVYTFTVKAADIVGNISVSNGLDFTTATGVVAPTYCVSAGQSVTDEYISKVELETINNSSTAQSYSDFTSLSTNLNKGNSYTITVTPAWTGTAYAEGYSVWIDYNQDGDFTDAGEQVWTKAASTTTPVGGSFTIPLGATSGPTRMRVSMKYNGIPTSCESFGYGEVEDYTVSIGNSTPDTQAPTAPLNLSVSNITETTATLSWLPSTDNVGVTGYNVYKGPTLISSVSGTSFDLIGLIVGTSYNGFTVKAKDATGNTSVASNSLDLTTTAATVLIYCASAGQSVTDEYISKVELATINNPSNAQLYSDFTSLSTNLNKGNSYTITVTPAWTGTAYAEGYSVWIDYNQDGDFTDAGEQVWTEAASTTTPVSGSFTIPSGATSGPTRMRVSMKWNGIPTSCESFGYGEVEDYTVNIVSSSAFSTFASISEEEKEIEGLSVFPNPINNGLLSVVYTNYKADLETTLVVRDVFGRVIRTIEVASKTTLFNIDDLNTGVYLITIETEEGTITNKFIKK